MTKDRLQEMKKLMQETENHDDRENTNQEKLTPLVTFFEHARTLRLGIQDLKSRVNDLKILLNNSQEWSNSDSSKELTRLRADPDPKKVTKEITPGEKIEHKIEEEKLIIGNLATAIRNNIKTMKSARWDSKGVSVIQRIKEVQLRAILDEFNEVVRAYLQCLVQHRERLVKIFHDMLEVKGDETSNIDSLLEEGKISIFTNNLLIGDLEEKLTLNEAKEAHMKTVKIESSILEIRNLFNELALIVDLQAEGVDEVEKLVDKNLRKVESGNAKLASARKKKGKLRYKKLLVALMCGGVILIVLLIFTVI